MSKKTWSKRFLSLLLILTIVFSFCACKSNPDSEVSPDSTKGTATVAPTDSAVDTAVTTVSDIAYDSTGRYVLNTTTGEAIINDVDMSAYSELTDNDNSRVFYHIFVGSFSDSNGDGIGDLRGIINRIDYLNDGDPDSGESLGVEGIWLSPIFESPSYHKYDTTDYYTIDPSYGTMEDLKELVNLCHERGIKLILDLVINHSGSKNQWFLNFCSAHRHGDTEDEYYDFYSYNDSISLGSRSFSKISSSDDFYECNFSSDMPELNYDNPFVYDTMVEVARYYLEDIDVDGFRFDAAKYIYYGETARNVDFWAKYMTDLREIKPEIYTVAEVWDSDSMTLQYAPALNCFDFSMSQVDGMISSTTKHGDVNAFTSYVESYLQLMNNSVNSYRDGNSDLSLIYNTPMLISFISNHDMDRAAGYMTYASGYAKMAANLSILNTGSSFIYYGEEIAMKGSRGSANTDANRRLAMLWGDGDTVKDPEGTTFTVDKQTNGTVADMLGNGDSLINHYKKLIMIRKANPEIASGDYHALSISGSKLGGFVSVLDTENGLSSSVVVFHNTTGGPLTVDLSTITLTDGSPLSTLFDVNSADISAFISASMELEKTDVSLNGTILTVPEQSSVVLR